MLFTFEAGQNESTPIVFLHGGGLSSRAWEPVIERLPEFHCLAPDLPQQGRSRAIPYSIEGSARGVAEIIRQRVPGGQAHIVAHSLGGPVAFTLLRLAPELVLSTLITGGSGQVSPWMARIGIWSLWSVKLFKAETLINATLRQQSIPEEYAPLIREDLRAGLDLDFNRRYMLELASWRLPEQVVTPLQLVVGEKEPKAARGFARAFLRAFPAARGAIVPGMGHAWNLQDPALFARMVRAWVTGGGVPAEFQPLAA
jgi:pimeloyl-ACP methyl ester carboxylesterase